MNPEREEIAIVGMAGRFPGARNVDEFWENLASGVESIVRFSDDDLRPHVSPNDLENPDYVRAGTVLEDGDCFDASFFGYSSREAEIMDPQQRILLECAWSALEDSGHDPDYFEGRIGVFGGVAPNTYYDENLTSHRELLDSLGRYPVMLAKEREYAATRVAYKLNLRGPAVSVNTACSTSGVALHLACQSVLIGETDMALVGGARLRVPTKSGYVYVEDGILSPDGHCRAFDADARGTVVGNGVAVIAIRRLSDALQDGDNIYAIIKGTAINNDGADKIGFTAPSVRGQVDVIAEALAVADVDPATIGYVEAHGTGTSLGDPIEVAALTEAYRRWTTETGYCGIGSLKTNIGHLDAAAGITGVIKAALALRNQVIPPSLNFKSPNPQINFDDSPFFVVDRLRPWETQAGQPRRAGVSTFGLGGTNAHIILEEAPVIATQPGKRLDRALVFSARTKEQLQTLTAELADYLGRNENISLDDVAFTQQTGRRRFEHRGVAVASDVREAQEALAAGSAHRNVSMLSSTAEARDVVLMFPGGGAQHVNMAADLYKTEPVFRRAANESFDRLSADGIDLKGLLYPEDVETVNPADLEKPSVALPTLFTIEYALARLWRSWGIVPKAMVGHSMGEYTAAHLAGVFTLQEALRLVCARGRLFETLADGSMLAVPLSENELRPYLTEHLAIAAINRPDTCVVSGPQEDVQALADELSRKEIDSTPLHISVAAHSPQVDPILSEFRTVLRSVNFQPPKIRFVSNVTGTWITDDEATSAEYWVRHLRQTVRFSEGLETLMSEGDYVLLEVGPGRTLSTFASQHPARGTHDVVSSMRHPKEAVRDDRFITQSLGRLWMVGVDIDWAAYYKDEQRTRVPLPTYPFERTRYWLDGVRTEVPVSQPSGAAAPAREQLQPDGAAGNRSAAASTSAVAAPSRSRAERITDRLKEIIHDLSGIEVADLDPDATFLELGFDSLFLTQANTAFRKEFKVKISFRQLFEDAPTINALSQFIDGELPADAFPPPEETMPATLPQATVETSRAGTPGSPIPAPDFSGGDASVVEQVIREQLEIMRQQLAVLNGTSGTQIPQALARTREDAAGKMRSAPTRTKSREAGKPDSTASDRPATGPWKPIEKGGGGSLSPRQQEALNALIERFSRKTAKSKELTQAYRRPLSDPRTVAGFRLPWKEIVYPIVVERAKGCKLWDVDGNEWIDLSMGFGVTLFGHSPDFLVEAVRKQLEDFIAIGPQTALAGKAAELLCELTGFDRAAFCNTGSEAVLAAIRMARTVTGRDRIATFSGDYHGIFDEVLVKGISVGGQTRTMPVAPGIPRKAVEDVLMLDYGETESLSIIEEHASELAAVLVEPVQSRRPDLQPGEFLQALRALTERLDIPLIFDEMVTGFRPGPGGAQEYFGVKADIGTYGKVIGTGMPIGVVAGKSEYMDALDGGMWRYGDDSVPEVGVTWFAGTFVRHPLSVAAVYATMKRLKEAGPQLQKELNRKTDRFVKELNAFFSDCGAPVVINHFASQLQIKVDPGNDVNALFWHFLRDRGVHCYDSRPHYITTAHTEEDMDALVAAFKGAVADMQEAGFFPDGRSAAKPDVGVVKELPLTEGQREIWLATRMGPEASCAFHLSLTLDLRGELDRDAMAQALTRLAERHEALRSVIDDSGQVQRVLPEMPIDVPFVDLSGLDIQEREARYQQAVLDDSKSPFELSTGPLIRASLYQIGTLEFRLLLTAHHIVCDGWSMGILVKDLAALYRRATGESKASLTDPLQFADYVAWDEDERAIDGESAESFWLEQFADPVVSLDLPVDRPRTGERTYHAGQESIRLSSGDLAALKKAATRSGATVVSVLMAAYALLLYRLTSQRDVVIGLASAGQSSMGARDLVGHCVSLLPLRLRAGDKDPFSDFLSTVRSAVLDAFDHKSFTFGDLLQKVKLRRDAGRSPLISTIITYESDTAGIDFGPLHFEIRNNPKSFCNFDLELYLTETDRGLQIDLRHNSDILAADTISRWLESYATILRNVIDESDESVSTFEILPPAEKRKLLSEWGVGDRAGMRSAVLGDLISERTSVDPARTALTVGHNDWTYADVWSRSNQLAQHLVAQGVEPGSCVGVLLPRSAELVISILGILKAGGAYVPLDPAYPKERTEFILEDSQASVLVTEEQLLDRVAGYRGTVVCVDRDREAIAKQSRKSPDVQVRPEDLAYVIYTSGSTGKPKGVAIEHRNTVALLEWARTVYTGEELSGVLASTSVCFDLSVFELFLPLSVGGRVVLVDSALDLLSLSDGMGVTLVNTVPSVMAEVLRQGRLPSSVRVVNLAGEPLASQLVDKLYSHGVDRVFDLYGPSETTTYSTYALRERGGPETIGGPVANERVYVLDGSGKPVPIGVPGELFIGGAGVARGYLHRPELTAERFVGDPFSDEPGARMYRTGDLVRWRSDGRLEFLGRKDYQVKIRGFRIELGEIESVLRKAPGVREVVVVARETERGEKELVGYVAAGDGVTVTLLREHLRKELPDYMVPSVFVLLEAMPLTPNGKIDRKSLPEPDETRPELEQGYVAPRNEIERKLAEIWSEVLGVEQVGVQDDFFELGGHSLMAVDLFAKINRAFDTDLGIITLFTRPSVAALGQVLTSVDPVSENGQVEKIKL